MKLGGACYVGTTLSKKPGRRWVVVGWTEDDERCVLAGLPESPRAAYSTVLGSEARVVRSAELQKAVDDGVLIAAGNLGIAAMSLVVRALSNDQCTSKSVRATLGRIGR